MSLKTIMKSQGINVAQQLIDTALSVGKAAIHAAMPDDFEYYLWLAQHRYTEAEWLELLGKEPDWRYFAACAYKMEADGKPAMPTLFNDSFAPVDINIAGTFGRKIRLLLNYKDPWIQTGGKQILALNFGKVAGVEVGVKTGYGMTKVLQHILNASSKTEAESGKPYYLKFYNYALNTAYLVDVVNYTVNQNMGSNMIWNYQITLRAVAPLSSFSNIGNKMKNLLPEVASNSVANGVTNIVNGMTRLF